MPIDLSPEEFRRLGYRAVDMLADRLAQLHDLPVRRPVPPDLREKILHQPVPEDVTDADTLLTTIQSDILPYPMGNASSRFFAWVNSPPAPLGIIAELLAAGHNASVAGGDHAATYIEHAVLNWLKTLFHLPSDSGGLLCSGGSVANIIALAVMRHVQAGGNMRAHGFNGESAPMVVYTSTQGHSCLQKAIELLGIGNDYLRRIPVNDRYEMDIAALQAQIAADKAAGLRPVCIAASAGTVNTGAIDPLNALADICEQENLWLHVDGAYGGMGILARPELYSGMERADSLAIDPHKWLYMPVECGCVFVRDEAKMRETFSVIPPYLRDDRDMPWFSEYGIQQTRGFKALKLWVVMQQIGIEGYRDLIQRDIDLSKTLQSKIRHHPDFELTAAGELSITCFRYAPAGIAAEQLDELNRELVLIVQREGQAFLTTTILNNQRVLRVCIVNFRTTDADLDILLAALADAGQRLIITRSM